MTFDEARERHPGLGFCVYAMEPGGPVVLEIHTPDGLFNVPGPTLAAAIELALPEPRPPPEPGAFD